MNRPTSSLLSVLMLLGLLGGVTSDLAAAQNVVADGGFEDGIPNPSWDGFSSVFGTPLCDVPVCGVGGGTGPHSGSYWAWFGGVPLVETATLSQDVTIPVGNALLTFWLEIPVGSDTGRDSLQVLLDETVVFSVTDLAASTYPTYRQVTILACDFADGGLHRLVFASSVSGSQSGLTSFFVDDIQLDVGRTTTFCDVPSEHWALASIEAVHAAGITAGCGTEPTQYCPEASVTREQMAIFLLRAMGITPPACTSDPFPDVSCSSPFAPWIAELVNRGITAGCGGGSYCPKSLVTREQMAIFLLRAMGVTPPACTTPSFGDVPCASIFADWIAELVARGITAGCGGGLYCPGNAVTRAQMAVFLVRAFGLPL